MSSEIYVNQLSFGPTARRYFDREQAGDQYLPGTVAGVFLLEKFPWPSCPQLPSPQH